MPNQSLTEEQKEAIRRIQQRQVKQNKTGAITEKKETPTEPLSPINTPTPSKKRFPYMLLLLIGIVGIFIVFLGDYFQNFEFIKISDKTKFTQEEQESIGDQSIKSNKVANLTIGDFTEDNEINNIVITITKENTLYLNNHLVNLDSLTEKIRQEIGENTDKLIYLVAEQNVSQDKVDQVIDRIEKGTTEMIIIVRKSLY
jgi:biopolymer transport protein ExbD